MMYKGEFCKKIHSIIDFSEEKLKEYGIKNYKDIYKDIKEHKYVNDYLKLIKTSNNAGFLYTNEAIRGYCPLLCKNLSCYIFNNEEYYFTSIVQEIDFENQTFKTLNSTYKYEFINFEKFK